MLAASAICDLAELCGRVQRVSRRGAAERTEDDNLVAWGLNATQQNFARYRRWLVLLGHVLEQHRPGVERSRPHQSQRQR